MPSQATHPSPDNCPVEASAKRMERIAKDMAASMRQLRRDKRACEQCSIAMEGCPILHAHRPLVEAAINTVIEEWNLAEVML